MSTGDLSLTDAQKLDFTGVYYNEKEGSYRQLGGEFNEDATVFSYFTYHMGNHFVVLSADLCAIQFLVGETRYSFKGEERVSDVVPILKDGKMMLPIRMIAEYFGALVAWSGESKTVDISKGELHLSFQIGSELPNSVGIAIIEGDRSYVPLRYIAESFHANIIWDSEEEKISVYR